MIMNYMTARLQSVPPALKVCDGYNVWWVEL